MRKILAISGSTRKNSSNLNYITAFAALSAERFELSIYTEIDKLPHFNPDLDNDNPPDEVIEFRRQLKEADGILICTPEYAMGVPGTLKNAIDWAVSSSEFSHKPTALITASLSGEKGHASLLETLKIIEAKITDGTQLLISNARTKVNSESEIIEPITLLAVKKLIDEISVLMDGS